MKPSDHFKMAEETLRDWEKRPERQPQVSDLFECHIFCAPLNPDSTSKQRFKEICRQVGMTGISLGLDFEGQGVVDVLSSKKFCNSVGPQEPLREMLGHAEALNEHFEVLRLKLEVRAGSAGVPHSDEEMRCMDRLTGMENYFEFHIKLEDQPLSAERDQALKALGEELRAELGTRVPFSCQTQAKKEQRFLNLRSYGMGLNSSRRLLEKITTASEARGFMVEKVIEELIIFDSFKALDGGWLEPSAGAQL